MKTIITETKVISDITGLPTGIQVTRATFDDNGDFVSSELIGFYTLTAAAVDSLNTTNETLASQVGILQTSVTTLAADKASLQTQVTSLSSEVTALQAQVSNLLQNQRFDPNIIRSEAFYQRINGDERFRLGVLALTDNTAKGILSLLNEYLTNDWQVLLDDPQVVGAMQYLGGVLPISETRVSEILRPATSDEAFITNE